MHYIVEGIFYIPSIFSRVFFNTLDFACGIAL